MEPSPRRTQEVKACAAGLPPRLPSRAPQLAPNFNTMAGVHLAATLTHGGTVHSRRGRAPTSSLVAGAGPTVALSNSACAQASLVVSAWPADRWQSLHAKGRTFVPVARHPAPSRPEARPAPSSMRPCFLCVALGVLGIGVAPQPMKAQAAACLATIGKYTRRMSAHHCHAGTSSTNCRGGQKRWRSVNSVSSSTLAPAREYQEAAQRSPQACNVVGEWWPPPIAAEAGTWARLRTATAHSDWDASLPGCG